MADVTSALRDGKTWLGLIVLALVLLVGIFVTGPFRLWSWLVAFKTWLLVLVVLELAMALATRSRDVKVYLGIGVSVFFIWLAFRKLDPAMMWDSIVSANPWLLGFVSAQVLFMLFVRGHRWALFLKPVKPGLSWIALGWSTCIGFAVNNLLPARLGEIARSVSAARKTDIPFPTIFGTVVVERIYDTLSILVLFVLSLFLWDFAGPMDKLAAAVKGEFGYEITQQSIAVNLSILVGLIIAIVIVLKWKTEFSVKVTRLILTPLPARWTEKIVGVQRTFIGGLTQTTNPLEVIWIIFLSGSLWVISWFSVLVGLWACGIDATSTDAVMVIMAMVVAVSIPASPGYVGTYHFLAATAITLTAGVSWDQAMGAATVIHLANYLPQTLSGLFALGREDLSIRQIQATAEKAT